MTTGQAQAVEQCCALEGGVLCLADTFQGWHLCEQHLRRIKRYTVVEEGADQGPVEQRDRRS